MLTIVFLASVCVGVPAFFIWLNRVDNNSLNSINEGQMNTIQARFNNLWDELEFLKKQCADIGVPTVEIPADTIRKVRKLTKKAAKKAK